MNGTGYYFHSCTTSTKDYLATVWKDRDKLGQSQRAGLGQFVT